MRTVRRPSSLVAAIAATSLALAQTGPTRADEAAATAQSQAAAPSSAEPSPAASGGADLPSRVGRLARIAGTVSFHTADEDHWDPATLNYPVTSGDAFWTEPQASAALEVADSRIDMASTTEFDVDQLDDHTLTATEAQGETFLDLRGMQPDETVVVRTPRGTVTMSTDGQYEVVAGDTQAPTSVSVVTGAAQVSGDNLSLSVGAGQAATITGSGGSGDAFQGSVGAAQRDAFLVSELSAPPEATAQASVVAHAEPRATATARAVARVAATPAAVRQMPGGSDLADYGSWQNSEQYGQLWYPEVGADWVPYRDGRWAYVAPWGWTWIDDESWGYAPFHYGRWLQVGPRWAWAPTYWAPGFAQPAYWRPVYAPALVGFFGYGPGLAAGLAIGGGIGFGFGFGLGFGGFGFAHIGWCPLGWGEPFHPWFGGAGYFDRVNRFDVANIHNVVYNNSVHNVTINNFANAARGATVVPTAAMLASRRASSVAERFSRDDFAQAHPVSSTPTPTRATAGVTPRVASRLGLPNTAGASAAHAPGPSVGSAAHGAVALRTPTAPVAAVRHAATVAGGAALAHNGLPALRTAGAVPRAVGGAPGPAFTLHGAMAGAGRAQVAANGDGHAAPGPAITHAGVAAPLAHGSLPSLRTHGPSGNVGASPAFRDQASRDQASTHGFSQSPAHTPTLHDTAPHSTAPHSTAPRYTAPHATSPQTQHYDYRAPQHTQTPSYQHYQSTPQVSHYGQTPQHFQSAPSFQHYQQTPQYPRYGSTPQVPHYQAPTRSYTPPAYHAPAPAYHAPAPKRPWPP